MVPEPGQRPRRRTRACGPAGGVRTWEGGGIESPDDAERRESVICIVVADPPRAAKIL